jgi:hypothetical protein
MMYDACIDWGRSFRWVENYHTVTKKERKKRMPVEADRSCKNGSSVGQLC